MPSFPLGIPQPTVSGDPVSLALTMDTDPDNQVVGDLHLRNGQIHFWDRQEHRRQKIRMVLLFFKGEWYLNPDEGIPYFGSIIGTKKRKIVLNIFRDALRKSLPDLATIRAMNLTFDGVTRRAAVDFEVLFDDGTILNSADFGPLEIKVP